MLQCNFSKRSFEYIMFGARQLLKSTRHLFCCTQVMSRHEGNTGMNKEL